MPANARSTATKARMGSFFTGSLLLSGFANRPIYRPFPLLGVPVAVKLQKKL
jgi:hypothetical protein